MGFLFGWFLDRRLNTFPWLTIVLLVCGFLAAAREVWMCVKDSGSKEQ
jgi:F0F1-type ATP synthase assembly protein I